MPPSCGEQAIIAGRKNIRLSQFRASQMKSIELLKAEADQFCCSCGELSVREVNQLDGFQPLPDPIRTQREWITIILQIMSWGSNELYPFGWYFEQCEHCFAFQVNTRL